MYRRSLYIQRQIVNGTSAFKLGLPDGDAAEITATFNGARTPAVALSLSMDDAKDVASGQGSPVQLFMSGKLSMEGDLAFAMACQPLFA